MLTPIAEQGIHELAFSKDVEIAAPVEIVFETLLEQLGPRHEGAPEAPLPMKLEPWPGGRWYRDLGNNTGHFWGHVQVIKPPTLLEICGPLFMSYPAISHLQYRLTAEGGVTRLKFIHRAIGQISPDHRDAMTKGMEPFSHTLKKVRELAERRKDAVGGSR
ncbi:MAG: ATPase [Armatimonadetes bacterium 13_1_40CM_64_14]|nr:MAG: ATPase [Armatimonadetes bacterium 13_1_40CM_64_14]